MYNNQIYYVVQAIIKDEQNFNISKDEQNKKIQKVFKGNEPKILRKKAFKYFKKLRDKYFIDYNNKSNWNYTKSENTTDCSYIMNNQYSTYLKFDLVISFGFKTDKKCDYYKNTFAIGAIGHGLRFIGLTLKTNLLIEYEFYKDNSHQMPKTQTLNLDYSRFHLKSGFINYFDFCNIPERQFILDILKDRIYTNYYHRYFKTPQFYKINTKDYTSKNPLFFDDLEKQINFVNNKKLKLYKKELTFLYQTLNKSKEKPKFKTLTRHNIKELLDLGRRKLSHLFTEGQFNLHRQIREELNIN